MSFDFDAAVGVPFRMQPGLRRVAPDQARLTPTDAAHLEEKLLVLGARPWEALLGVPGFDPAPALDRLAAQANREWPALFQGSGLGDLSAPGLGWRLRGQVPEALPSAPGPSPDPAPGFHPDAATRARIGTVLGALPPAWRAAALLSLAFREDFAIVDGQAATLPWLAVCLPSFWRPAEKIGLDFAAVHAPVADAELVRAAGPALMRMACGPTAWERFVWTLTPHPLLRALPGHDPRTAWPSEDEVDAAGLAAGCWLRHEHQGFLPVPGRDQAVFTIRVEREPLAVVTAVPGRAGRLAQALASMSEAVLGYRGLGPARERLLAWLAAQD